MISTVFARRVDKEKTTFQGVPLSEALVRGNLLTQPYEILLQEFL